MCRSKALWVEELLAPQMNGRVYEHIWITMIGDQYTVCKDYYMVEDGEVYMINDGTKQPSDDSLENTKNECVCIGKYDPNKTYERKIKHFSKEEINKLLFTNND